MGWNATVWQPPPLAPDPQRDLLRHRAAGHEHGGLLAQQLGDAGLEPADPLALAVRVAALVLGGLVGERLELLAQRRAAVPAVQVALGAGDGGLDAGFVGHVGAWL